MFASFVSLQAPEAPADCLACFFNYPLLFACAGYAEPAHAAVNINNPTDPGSGAFRMEFEKGCTTPKVALMVILNILKKRVKVNKLCPLRYDFVNLLQIFCAEFVRKIDFFRRFSGV